eukprot:Skav206583  [mRNA]  locus=scaffold925:924768:925124:+ [translate_table: standard]
MTESTAAGPPLPSHVLQTDSGTLRQTPQFTTFSLPPEETVDDPTAAGPPLPLHHWQAVGYTFLQTPQLTKPCKLRLWEVAFSENSAEATPKSTKVIKNCMIAMKSVQQAAKRFLSPDA